MNGVIDGTDLVYREYYDISIAVATPKGLVVPVLRNVEDLDFAGVERVGHSVGFAAKAISEHPWYLQSSCSFRPCKWCLPLAPVSGAVVQWNSMITSVVAVALSTLSAGRQEINKLGKKARDGTISIDDMAGGTFTISNGGVYGSLLSTPIINPPQSAILGMHAITQRPMVVGKDILPRPIMNVALTYDHRWASLMESPTAPNLNLCFDHVNPHPDTIPCFNLSLPWSLPSYVAQTYAAHHERCADVRPQADRRPRGGHIPEACQGRGGGPAPPAARRVDALPPPAV